MQTPSSLGSAYPTPRRANAMKLEMPTTPASGRGCRLAASQATDPAGVSPPPSIRQQCTREALTALPVPATRTSPPSAWSAPEQRAQRRLGSSSSDSALEHEAHSAFQRVSGTALQRAGNGNGNGCSGNDSVLTTAALSPPANHSAPEAVPLPVAEAETEAETEAALRMPTLPTRWLSDAQTVRRASQSPAGSPFRRSAGSSSSRWSAAQAPSPQRHVAATRRSEEARLTERQNKVCWHWHWRGEDREGKKRRKKKQSASTMLLSLIFTLAPFPSFAYYFNCVFPLGKGHSPEISGLTRPVSK